MTYLFNRVLSAGWLIFLACAVSPASTNLAKLGQACRAGQQKACSKLIRIATYGGLRHDVRQAARNELLAAVKELTDQAVLAAIAKDNFALPRVATAAVKKLTDQTILSRIAETDRSPWTRKAALNQLTDQSMLAEIAETDRDWGMRRAAVDKLTEQAVLAEVAKVAQDPDVREAAVGKLTDQAVLAEIAKTNSDQGMRRAAVTKLTDQVVLAVIAKTGSDQRVRRAAVTKLTDQALLAAIAKTDSNQGVRLAAVDKLSDQALLSEIAKSGSDQQLRLAAVNQLRDQTMLGDIAKTDTERGVRVAAVMKIKDSAVLSELAKSARDSTLGSASATNGTDKGPIEAVEDCNFAGQSVTTILFNTDMRPVAKWERQFDGSYIKSEKLIDLSSGKTLRVWTFDEFSRRVEEKMFVCLDGNGSWVRDKEGNPVLVKPFPAREQQATRIKYSDYNSRIPVRKTTTIEPCENCKGETGNLCSYVY